MFEKSKRFFCKQRANQCPAIPDALRKYCCICCSGIGEGEGENGTTHTVPIALIDNM